MNRITLFISIGLFIISLTQPCYCTTKSCGDSIAALLSGSIGFIYGGAALTWLANPILIISWCFVNRNPKLSLVTSVAAFLIALSFVLFDEIISDEAGHYSRIIGYRLGYWLWVYSSLIMVISNVIRHFQTSSKSLKIH